MTQEIHLNAVAPYDAPYTLSSDAFDLVAGSTARFEVEKPGGAPDVWSGAALSGAVGLPQSSVLITYAFQAGDLDIPGEYTFFPVVTTPSGEVFGEIVTLFVRDKFG